MAKGYWVGHVDIGDFESYKSYIQANKAVFSKFGARFLVRGGEFILKEGDSRSRTVVLEFPDYATAVACYESQDYQSIIDTRLTCSSADIIIIEGYDGPQPA